MAKETRIVFGVEDIKAVRLWCSISTCNREVLVPIGSEPPSACPFCYQGDWSRGRTHQLFLALESLREHGAGPVSIRFEIDGSRG